MLYTWAMHKRVRIALLFLCVVLMLTGSDYVGGMAPEPQSVGLFRVVSRSTGQTLDDDYEALLDDMYDTAQRLLWNLVLTSQQILSNEDVRQDICALHSVLSNYDKFICRSSLVETISMLTMPNPDIFFINVSNAKTGEVLYNNLPASAPLDANTDDTSRPRPILYQSGNFSFHGPAPSQCPYFKGSVLQLDRTENIDGIQVALSLETNPNALKGAFGNAERRHAVFTFVNAENNADIHSNGYTATAKGVHSGGSDDTPAAVHSALHQGAKCFSKSASQGFVIYLDVPRSVYTHDYILALRDAAIAAVAAALSLLCLVVYFKRSTAIIVRQERDASRLVLDKLRAQINPHFLLNTLNTIHWMALMGEKNADVDAREGSNHPILAQIDAAVQSLSHLLRYNLDKDNRTADITSAIDAITEYAALQKMRYRFSFQTDVEPAIKSAQCPKFVLQPLVENSLMHGYKEGMTITISASLKGNIIVICVTDDGLGMDEDTLRCIQGKDINKNEAQGTVSKSIGLQYVRHSMTSFSQDAAIDISSEKGQGTVVRLAFPYIQKPQGGTS